MEGDTGSDARHASENLKRPADSAIGPRRIAGFDGLRGIAVLLVILFHAQLLGSPSSFYVRLISAGWSGVDMFFVLSGFLITGILRRTREHPRYWRTFAIRRILRILPVYYLVLLLIFVVPGLSGRAPEGPPFWVYPTFISNFWVADSPAPLALVVTWSLSIEEQFYVIWPFIVRTFDLRRLAWVCGLLIVASPIIRYFIHDPTNEVSYMWTQARMDTLAWGALAWIMWEKRSTKWIEIASRLAPWGVGGWTALLAFSGDVRSDPFFAVVGFTTFSAIMAAVILGLASGTLASWNRTLEWGPLSHLGRVSFGAYLLHLPIIIGLRSTAIDGNQFLGMVVTVALTWAAATVMWRLVETPILAQKDRLAPY